MPSVRTSTRKLDQSSWQAGFEACLAALTTDNGLRAEHGLLTAQDIVGQLGQAALASA